MDSTELNRMKRPLFTEDEVAKIIGAVIKGLAPVHQLNYIHRDIKPENIILAPSENQDADAINSDQSGLKIIDFGFSAHYSLHQNDSKLDGNIGTVLFMAPEQI